MARSCALFPQPPGSRARKTSCCRSSAPANLPVTPHRPRRARQAGSRECPAVPATRRQSRRASERRRGTGGNLCHRCRRGRADQPNRGRRPARFRRSAQSLSLRQVQDQAETRAEAVARSPDRGDRRPGRSAERAYQPLDKTAEAVFFTRDLVSEPANVIYPETLAAQAAKLSESRRRGRDPRREQDARARHERLARGRRKAACGRRASWSWSGAARTGAGSDRRNAARVYRQGRHVRYRRHLDQAGRRHGRHEMGHGGLRRGHRPDAAARRAQGQGQCGRRRRAGREHAVGHGAAAGRHRHARCRVRRSRS